MYDLILHIPGTKENIYRLKRIGMVAGILCILFFMFRIASLHVDIFEKKVHVKAAYHQVVLQEMNEQSNLYRRDLYEESSVQSLSLTNLKGVTQRDDRWLKSDSKMKEVFVDKNKDQNLSFNNSTLLKEKAVDFNIIRNIFLNQSFVKKNSFAQKEVHIKGKSKRSFKGIDLLRKLYLFTHPFVPIQDNAKQILNSGTTKRLGFRQSNENNERNYLNDNNRFTENDRLRGYFPHSLMNISVQISKDFKADENKGLQEKIEDQIKTMQLMKVILYVAQTFILLLMFYCLVGFYFVYRSTIQQMDKIKSQYMYTRQKLKKVEKKMASKIMKAHEEERKRVSRELHDGIGQSLYSIIVKLNVTYQRISSVEDRKNLAEVLEIVENTMGEIRRISHSLRPAILDDLGLIPALRSYLENFMKTYQIRVNINFSGKDDRLCPEIETHLYRICQEALTNIAKHAHAQIVNFSLLIKKDYVLLMIQDDGIGFSVKNIKNDPNKKGVGLFSMKERVDILKGQFDIFTEKGKGTKIIVQIPKESN